MVEHDLPDESALPISAFFDCFKEHRQAGKLALNIKGDGLASVLKEKLDELQITEYFCFDMSVPDTLQYLASKVTFYCRCSDLEPFVPLSRDRAGIWFDALMEGNADIEQAIEALKRGEESCLVSPELHGRPYVSVWKDWKNRLEKETENILTDLAVCTDFPDDFDAFFNGD